MTNIGSFDAKTHLPALLERVARGVVLQITRRGVPIARLVPAEAGRDRDPAEAARRIGQMRRGVRLKNRTVQELVREGRRF